MVCVVKFVDYSYFSMYLIEETENWFPRFLRISYHVFSEYIVYVQIRPCNISRYMLLVTVWYRLLYPQSNYVPILWEEINSVSKYVAAGDVIITISHRNKWVFFLDPFSSIDVCRNYKHSDNHYRKLSIPTQRQFPVPVNSCVIIYVQRSMIYFNQKFLRNE